MLHPALIIMQWHRLFAYSFALQHLVPNAGDLTRGSPFTEALSATSWHSGLSGLSFVIVFMQFPLYGISFQKWLVVQHEKSTSLMLVDGRPCT
jgi:hypothetical protein